MIFKQIHKQLKVHTLLILHISQFQRQATIKLKQSKNKKFNFIQNNVEKKNRKNESYYSYDRSKFISKILIMQFREDSYSNAKYENS